MVTAQQSADDLLKSISLAAAKIKVVDISKNPLDRVAASDHVCTPIFFFSFKNSFDIFSSDQPASQLNQQSFQIQSLIKEAEKLQSEAHAALATVSGGQASSEYVLSYIYFRTVLSNLSFGTFVSSSMLKQIGTEAPTSIARITIPASQPAKKTIVLKSPAQFHQIHQIFA